MIFHVISECRHKFISFWWWKDTFNKCLR